MKTACFIMFRNEASILPAFLDQIKEFFDFTCFVNHCSTDGGDEIVRHHLQNFGKGELFHLRTPGYHQREVTTVMTRRLFEMHSADVVTILDADEFLYFQNNTEFRVYLEAQLNRCEILSLNWLNIAPESFDGNDLFKKKFYFSQIGTLPKITLFRSLYELDRTYIVERGSHSVISLKSSDVRIHTPDDQYVLHIPIRSRAFFMMKLLNYKESLQHSFNADKPNEGRHIDDYLSKLGTLFESDELVTCYALRYAQHNNSEQVYNKKLLNFDFPYIQQICNDNAEHYIYDIACARYPHIMQSQTIYIHNIVIEYDYGAVFLSANADTVLGDVSYFHIVGQGTQASILSRLKNKMLRLLNTFKLIYKNSKQQNQR